MSTTKFIPTTLKVLSRDGWLLFVTRFTRLFAYGSLSVILVFYLIGLGLTSAQVGLVLTLTLVGDVANALREGRTVLIHCGAGVGRTGMAAIGVLLALGQPLDPAIVAVQRAGSQPETKDQAALVQWVERELEVHVMAKFVTLEHLSGGDFVVNIDHVVRIEQAQEGSIVHLSDGSEVEVKEVFPEVLEKLGGKPQG